MTDEVDHPDSDTRDHVDLYGGNLTGGTGDAGDPEDANINPWSLRLREFTFLRPPPPSSSPPASRRWRRVEGE